MLNIFLGSEAAFSPPASDEYNYSQIWPLRSRWKLNPAFLVLSCTSVTNVGSAKTRRKVTSENGCRQASTSESYFNDIFHYSAKLRTLPRRHTTATNGCWIFLHRLDSKTKCLEEFAPPPPPTEINICSRQVFWKKKNSNTRQKLRSQWLFSEGAAGQI